MGCVTNYRYVSDIAGYTYDTTIDFSLRNVVDFGKDSFDAIGQRLWGRETVEEEDDDIKKLVFSYVVDSENEPLFESFNKNATLRMYMKSCMIHEMVIQSNDDEFIRLAGHDREFFELREAVDNLRYGQVVKTYTTSQGLVDPIAVNVYKKTTK